MKNILYAQITIFILLVAFFIIPFPEDIHRTFFFVAGILGLIFLILGIILIVISRKEHGKLKLFLMLTGISAIAPLAGTILHNLFYALGIAFSSLHLFFEILHGSFFLISLLVAPITFLIGIIGSLVVLRKENSLKETVK